MKWKALVVEEAGVLSEDALLSDKYCNEVRYYDSAPVELAAEEEEEH